MEYGDLVVLRSWIRRRFFVFRYRIDPVPHTGKYHYRFYRWYKRPRSTQERKWSFAHEPYVRGRRKSCNLPNAYDDRQRGDVNTRKSWKNKKVRKQWMKNANVTQGVE